MVDVKPVSTQFILNAIVFLTAAGAAALVTLAIIPATRSAIAWGQAPAWVTAGLSLLAFAGVLVTVFRWREDSERHRDDEANQARLVLPTYEVAGKRNPYPAPAVVEVWVHNRSSEPIFDVSISAVFLVPFLVNLDEADGIKYDYENASGMTHFTSSLIEFFSAPPTVLAGESSAITRWTGDSFEETTKQGVAFMAQIEFTDARGRRWKRISAYSPERVIYAADNNAPSQVAGLFKD